MKSFRKLSVLMALVTLFSVATVFAIPVSAETSNLNSHLVTYYDFEGSTTADQLRDKAPAGSKNEALAFFGTGASVRDGVATIPQDSGIYTNTVTDVAAITGDSMTVFLHFKADYVLNSAVWADLFKINNVARVAPNNTTGKFVSVSYGSANTTLAGDTDDTNAAFAGSWMRMAIVMDQTTDKQIIYTSADDGVTWTSVNGTYTGAFASATQIYLGNGLSRGLALQFNEFRIYDVGLTESEIKAITPKSLSTASVTPAVNYNFSGDAASALTTDKAGKLNALNFKSTEGSASILKNGLAKLDATAGNYLLTSVPDGTVLTADGKMTVFARFKIDDPDETQTWQTLFRMDNNFQLAANPKNKKLAVCANNSIGAGNSKWLANATFMPGQWARVAITLDQCETGYVMTTVYFSGDDGLTWNSDTFLFPNTLAQGKKSVILGKNGTTADGYADVSFSDFRIYSSVLSYAQVRSLDAGAIRTLGVQTKDNGSTVDVRVVGVIDGIEGIEKVGFLGTAEAGGKSATLPDLSTGTVYTSIEAAGDSLNASDFGGSYLVALVIQNVPKDQDVTFRLFSFIGYDDESVVSDRVTTFTVSNGLIV